MTAREPVLTAEILTKALGQMMGPRPYGPHVHIVSPRHAERGWGICGQCGRMWGEWPEDEFESYESALDEVWRRR